MLTVTLAAGAGPPAALLLDEAAAPNAFPWPRMTHGAMHAHASNGNLVVSWFGGSEEGYPDVSIGVSVKTGDTWVWAGPVDNGGPDSGEPGLDRPGTLWQSPVFQPSGVDAPLIMHVHPGDWTTNRFFIRTSPDGGLTWSPRLPPPTGTGFAFRGAAKNRPLELPRANASYPAGTLLVGSEVAEAFTGPGRARPAIEILPPGNRLGHRAGAPPWRRLVLPDPEIALPVIQPTFVVLDPAHNRLLAICRAGNGAGPVYRSDDGGGTWHLTPVRAGGRGAEVVSLDVEGGPAQGWHVMAVDDRKNRETDLRISRDGYRWETVLSLPGASTYPTITQAADRRLHVVSAGNAETEEGSVPGWNVVRHFVLDPDILTGVRAPTGPPVLSQQPRDQAVHPGWEPVFACRAAGARPLRFQWEAQAPDSRAWQPVAGATGPVFRPRVSPDQDGNRYRCRVTNAAGTALSRPARLAVRPVPAAGANPILELTFDEAPGGARARDSSGADRHARLRAGARIDPDRGVRGGALFLPGRHTDWEARVPADPALIPVVVPSDPAAYPVSQWTVAFWVRAERWGTLFSIGQEVGACIRIGEDFSRRMTIEAHQERFTRPWPETGRWHHFALTFDGTRLRFYLDGEPVLDRPLRRKYLPPHLALSNDLELGGTWWGPPNTPAFRGHLDALRYLPYALSAEAVAALPGGPSVP
ncbi:MAG: exo-alpha-sialidase [Opitutales bacterium]